MLSLVGGLLVLRMFRRKADETARNQAVVAEMLEKGWRYDRLGPELNPEHVLKSGGGLAPDFAERDRARIERTTDPDGHRMIRPLGIHERVGRRHHQWPLSGMAALNALGFKTPEDTDERLVLSGKG